MKKASAHAAVFFVLILVMRVLRMLVVNQLWFIKILSDQIYWAGNQPDAMWNESYSTLYQIDEVLAKVDEVEDSVRGM